MDNTEYVKNLEEAYKTQATEILVDEYARLSVELEALETHMKVIKNELLSRALEAGTDEDLKSESGKFSVVEIRKYEHGEEIKNMEFELDKYKKQIKEAQDNEKQLGTAPYTVSHQIKFYVAKNT